MLGIVIWTNSKSTSSLIYCSDGRDLAFADADERHIPEVGALVHVDLETHAEGLRKAKNVRSLGLANAPELIRDLKESLAKGEGDFDWITSIDGILDEGIDPKPIANDASKCAAEHVDACFCSECRGA